MVCLKFRGTGRATIGADGCVRGASSGRHYRGVFVFECGEPDSADGAVAVSDGSIVASGMTITGNTITWGSESVKRTAYGLEIRIPESKQLQINGLRLRVSDIGRADRTQVVAATAEKTRVFRLVGGCVSRVTVDGDVHLHLARFPALSAESLDLSTSGNSSATLFGDLAVQRLRITANGHSTVGGAVAMIRAEEATLDTYGNSVVKDVCVLSWLSAYAHHHSTLCAAVADKNLAHDEQSGNATCRISRLDDASIRETAARLASLSELPTNAGRRTFASMVRPTVPLASLGRVGPMPSAGSSAAASASAPDESPADDGRKKRRFDTVKTETPVKKEPTE